MLSRPQIPDPLDYSIDPQTGFVPSQAVDLPEYYTPWCQLCSDLPQLLRAQTLRARVDCLETLSTEHLAGPAYWQRAYLVLGYLTQAYIWQDRTNPSPIIPTSIGDPFIKICNHLGTEPVLSYAGMSLSNWMPLSDNNGHSDAAQMLADFSSIRSFITFTGTRDEDAFNLVPSMVEATGGKVITLLLDIIRAERTGHAPDLLPVLQTCTSTFKRMAEILSVLHQNCNPDFFYHQIRPMLAGSAGAQDKGLPDGVTIQCSDRSDVVARCVGASAGQSSLFQFCDHMLGVEHGSKMLVTMRAYMPRLHREFLEAVEALPSLRDIVDRQHYPGDGEVLAAFHLALDALRHFRTKHIAIVSRYIVQPAAAEAKRMLADGLQVQPVVEERGTAGSKPVPFLKQYRDETVLI